MTTGRPCGAVLQTMAERKGTAKRNVTTNGPAIVVRARRRRFAPRFTTPLTGTSQTEHRYAAPSGEQPYGGCAARPAPAAPLFGPRDALSTHRRRLGSGRHCPADERGRAPHTHASQRAVGSHTRARAASGDGRGTFLARRQGQNRPTQRTPRRSRAPGPPPRTSSCCAPSRATARASGPSSRRTCRAARASSAGSGGTTS